MADITPQNTPVTPPSPAPSVPAKKSGPSKTFLLLMVIILSLGLIAGYFLFPTLFTNQQPQVTPKEVTQPLFLKLESPIGTISAVDKEILVKGTTLPNTTVVVYTNDDENSVESDENGVFETTVLIGEAGGLVKISAFSDVGEEESVVLDVAEKDVLGENTKANNSDKENNGKSNEKIGGPKETAVLNTNKTNQNSKKQVKSGPEKIKELLSQESTGSSKIKNIKKLEAVVATSGAKLKKHALSGIITASASGQLTITHQIKNERINIVVVNASTTVKIKGMENATVNDLQIGMRIAVVGTPMDNTLIASRIHVIPGKATGVFNKQPVSSASAAPTEDLTPTSATTPTVSVSPSPTLTPTPEETVTPTP